MLIKKRLIIVMISFLLRLICRYSKIPISISRALLLLNLSKLILNFKLEEQR